MLSVKRRKELEAHARVKASRLIEQGMAFVAVDPNQGTAEERKFYRWCLTLIAEGLRTQ